MELGNETLEERRVRFALECVCRDEFREAEELLAYIESTSSWADKAATLYALCVTEQAVDPVLKGKSILLSDLGQYLAFKFSPALDKICTHTHTPSFITGQIDSSNRAQSLVERSPLLHRIFESLRSSHILSRSWNTQALLVAIASHEVLFTEGRSLQQVFGFFAFSHNVHPH